MISILEAIAPVFLIIAAGYAIRSRAMLPESFWAPVESITFWCFFPALLFYRTSTAQLAGLPLVEMLVALAAAIVVCGLLVVALVPAMKPSGPTFTTLLQGSIRSNVYIGLAAATGLFGAEGTALGAVAVAGMTPLVNFLSVVALARFGRSERKPSARDVAKAVITNPIIVSVLCGFGLNLSGIELPRLATETVRILGAPSLPLALLAVGAGLDLATARQAGRQVLVSSAIKLLAMPLVAWAACLAMGVGPTPTTVVVLFAALPTATSGYIMARKLGGDARLMAAIISAQTVASAIFLPVVLILLR
ncbi:MAG: AEC family transporter [Proteobacteria bacterium]|nr:AEC family transporter [Pseudomonadota bacterium]